MESGTRIIRFASAHDFPKFVEVDAAMEQELRKVGTRPGRDLVTALSKSLGDEGKAATIFDKFAASLANISDDRHNRDGIWNQRLSNAFRSKQKCSSNVAFGFWLHQMNEIVA